MLLCAAAAVGKSALQTHTHIGFVVWIRRPPEGEGVGHKVKSKDETEHCQTDTAREINTLVLVTRERASIFFGSRKKCFCSLGVFSKRLFKNV